MPLTIPLDHGSDVPLYRQIVDHMWLAVIEGELDPGDRLPTVRQLAIDLGVNPNSVERAYVELEYLGVVSTRNREGTFVCLRPPDKSEIERRLQLDRLCREIVSRTEDMGLTVREVIEALSEVRTTPPYEGVEE